MIRREDMTPEAWASMCIPLNEVIPTDPPHNKGALYIGSWFASVDEDLLSQHKLKELVSVNDSQMTLCPTAARNGYEIRIADSTAAELKPFLEDVCNHIEKKLSSGENVLVHCQQVRFLLMIRRCLTH